MFHSRMTFCAAALLLAGAGAHAAPPRPDDAAAAVPETRYRAAQAYRPAERPATTPDRHWAEANRKVAATNSMMLTMPEQAVPRPATPAQRAAAEPAQPAASEPAQPAAAAADTGHDHGNHGNHGRQGGH